MKSHRSHRTKKARIEIIPLIDVIFFLLATFVLVSISMTKMPGPPIDVPATRTSRPNTLGKTTVTVSVTDRGELFWGKDSLSFSQFLDRIETYGGTPEADHNIILSADKDAPYAQVATILDEIRKSGVKKVSIQSSIEHSKR